MSYRSGLADRAGRGGRVREIVSDHRALVDGAASRSEEVTVDRTRQRIIAGVVLVVGAAVALVATWWVMGDLAGDGCAWIAGFGGCR
jgi:hypothetical protein